MTLNVFHAMRKTRRHLAQYRMLLKEHRTLLREQRFLKHDRELSKKINGNQEVKINELKKELDFFKKKSEELQQGYTLIDNFNTTILDQNKELRSDLAREQLAHKETQAHVKKLEEEISEMRTENLIIINKKTLSRKEARAIKNHKPL